MLGSTIPVLACVVALISAAKAALPASGSTYHIVNPATGLFVDDFGSVTTPGNSIISFPLTGGANQIWEATLLASGGTTSGVYTFSCSLPAAVVSSMPSERRVPASPRRASPSRSTSASSPGPMPLRSRCPPLSSQSLRRRRVQASSLCRPSARATCTSAGGSTWSLEVRLSYDSEARERLTLEMARATEGTSCTRTSSLRFQKLRGKFGHGSIRHLCCAMLHNGYTMGLALLLRRVLPQSRGTQTESATNFHCWSGLLAFSG